MEIYFVRHGLTQHNLDHHFQGGRVDSPLLPSGVQGAVEAGKFLANTHFAAAVSSPQLRARTTAEKILAENVAAPQLVIDERLREMDFGDWDGLPEDQVNQKPAFKLMMEHPEQYDPQQAGGGETYAAFVKRTTTALHERIAALDAASDAKLLVVSHGLVTTMSIKTLLGDPIADLRKPLYLNGHKMATVGHGIVDNDSVTIVSTKDNQHFTVTDWNNTSFLTHAKN